MSTLPYLPATQLSAAPWHQQQHHPHHTSVQTSYQSPDGPGQVVFSRERNIMPNENKVEPGVLNKSDPEVSQAEGGSTPRLTRAGTLTILLRPRNRSPSPSPHSRPPLTPEESPPVKSTRKRSAGIVEQEDKTITSTEVSPVHLRANSGEQTVHVCICQPDPKIPRPRNEVVSHNPGLANPEISKIIGERWQSLPQEEKNRWKALAEEEKLRHQQQYPTYRYQPKRNGRRNSLSSETPCSAGEKQNCVKCGGRTILTPSTPFAVGHGNSVPMTPGSSSATPVTKTLPVLRELSLQSPAGQYMGRHHSTMSPPHHSHLDERDDLGPLSPGNKRRRFNGDHPPTVTRTMPPRYSVVKTGTVTGPGTPYPFVTAPPNQPYQLAVVHDRRESLPGLRGVISPPGSMAPPLRPGMGYAQHRMSQGYTGTDRSLTLPPIQVGHVECAEPSADLHRSAEELIMSVSFRHKIKILSQVAPPATRTEGGRGPFIAVEGENAEAAKNLAHWLKNVLAKEDEISPSLMEGPDVSPSGSKQQMMVQYHRLAAKWLTKSNDVLDRITVPTEMPASADTTVSDAVDATEAQTSRKIDGDYTVAEDADAKSESHADSDRTSGEKRDSKSSEKMEADQASKRSSMISTSSNKSALKPVPVALVANYSLHSANRFACAIPIGLPDPYAPNDHWQWSATQWRGIIGPDLVIYVRDALPDESNAAAVEIEDSGKGVALFVVVRTRDEEYVSDGESKEEPLRIEPSMLRRVGFEVSEWAKAFGKHTK